MMSIVSIVRTPKNPAWCHINEAVRRAVDLAGGIPCDRGDLVLVKPNLVALPPREDSGAVTRVEIARSVADILREIGARPIIAESAGVGSDTSEIMAHLGYSALSDHGYHVIDLKHTNTERVSLGIPGLENVRIFRLALEADLIVNLPVMKTHDQSEVTLALKNLKDLIADASKMAMHRHALFDGVAALAEALPPVFTVMDAITAQEGVGPVYGDPVPMNLVLSSCDMVAMDVVAGGIMGYTPEEVPITMKAAARGIGTLNPVVVGENLPEVSRRFRRAKEAAEEAIPPGSVLFGEDACTGCRNTVLTVIWQLKMEGDLDLLKGHTLVAGSVSQEIAGAIRVGRCASVGNSNGLLVKGCPPENSEIIDALRGFPQGEIDCEAP